MVFLGEVPEGHFLCALVDEEEIRDGVSGFAAPDDADQNNLLDNKPEKLAKIEGAMADVRARFGTPAINRGRALLSRSADKT